MACSSLHVEDCRSDFIIENNSMKFTTQVFKISIISSISFLSTPFFFQQLGKIYLIWESTRTIRLQLWNRLEAQKYERSQSDGVDYLAPGLGNTYLFRIFFPQMKSIWLINYIVRVLLLAIAPLAAIFRLTCDQSDVNTI